MIEDATIWKIQQDLMELAKSIETQHGVALLSVRYNRDDEGRTQSVCLSYEDRTETYVAEDDNKTGLKLWKKKTI